MKISQSIVKNPVKVWDSVLPGIPEAGMRREVEHDRNNDKITSRAVRFLSSTKYLAVRPNADT